MDFFKTIIDEIRNEYEKDDAIRAMIVTGSVARGEAHEGNDLDILLVSNDKKIAKEYRVGTSLVELGTIQLPQAFEQISNSSMLVYLYLDAKAIFDKDNQLPLLKAKAQEVLSSYTVLDQSKTVIIKWLSSVIDKIIVAQKHDDQEKVAFQTANVLWKTVEGLYMVNALPVPASTSALGRIHTLKVVPENFQKLWKEMLFGNIDQRAEATIALMKFILSKM